MRRDRSRELNMLQETLQILEQGYYVKDADVEEFDKEFPAKEKLKLPGQIFD